MKLGIIANISVEKQDGYRLSGPKNSSRGRARGQGRLSGHARDAS